MNYPCSHYTKNTAYLQDVRPSSHHNINLLHFRTLTRYISDFFSGACLGGTTDFRVDTTLLTTDAAKVLAVTAVVLDEDEATMGETRITGLLLADNEDEDAGDDITDGDDDDAEDNMAVAGMVLTWLTAVVTRTMPEVAATVVGAEGPFTERETSFSSPALFSTHT